MKSITIAALAAISTVIGAPTAAAVPSIDLAVYEDLSTTDAICSTNRHVLNVQNGTCLSVSPGFNSYSVLTLRDFTGNEECILAAVERCQAGPTPAYSLIGIQNNQFNSSCQATQSQGQRTIAHAFELACLRQTS